MHLESAFRKFFHEPSAGFPRFKSKKSSRKSYTTNVVNGNIFLEGKYLKLPKMTAIRTKLHRPISEKWKLKSVTVSREPSGKYFASLLFCCENQTVEKIPAEKFLGIDFAMHGLGVFSTGEKAAYPMFTEGQRKNWRENREGCPNVRKEAEITGNRKRELLCVMKRSETREKIFSINSAPVLRKYMMQCAWKI